MYLQVKPFKLERAGVSRLCVCVAPEGKNQRKKREKQGVGPRLRYGECGLLNWICRRVLKMAEFLLAYPCVVPISCKEHQLFGFGGKTVH